MAVVVGILAFCGRRGQPLPTRCTEGARSIWATRLCEYTADGLSVLVVVQVGPASARAGKALAPVGESLSKLGERTVGPVAKETLGKSEAALSGALKSAESALSAQVGFDVPLEKTVTTVAKEAPGVAKAAVPVVQSVVEVRRLTVLGAISLRCTSHAVSSQRLTTTAP
jgi:hypothetical protein